MTVGVAVREGEVGRVVRHRVTLGLDAEAHVGQREVGTGGLGNSDVLNGVAVMCVKCRLQSLVQLHIGVQRVIFGTCLLLGNRIVERCRNLQLVREELA